MAAVVKIVPPQDWAVIQKYLDSEGIILVPENSVSSLCNHEADMVMKLRGIDGKQVEYDFGGQPDVSVDKAIASDDYTSAYLYELLTGTERV